MNFPVLKPDGLILFSNSWKKYPKRAAAEGQKAWFVLPFQNKRGLKSKK